MPNLLVDSRHPLVIAALGRIAESLGPIDTQALGQAHWIAAVALALTACDCAAADGVLKDVLAAAEEIRKRVRALDRTLRAATIEPIQGNPDA